MRHNLRTKQTKLTKLHQHPSNPRNGDVDLIAESLHTNGQYKPIVVTPDGTILAGNHTYQAALGLGWESLATVTVDVESGSAEAKRIMLADNKTSDVAANRYDDGLLLALLESLDGDLVGTGYDQLQVGDLSPPVLNPEPSITAPGCPKCGWVA